MRTSNVSPSEVKNKLSSWIYVATQIRDGLNGIPFDWTGGEFEAYRVKAEAMGLTLITKTQVTKQGYRLRQGARPVGRGYFRAPISRSADLYILECQAVKEEAPENAG